MWWKEIYLQLAGCSPNLRISWSCVNLTKASYCSVERINTHYGLLTTNCSLYHSHFIFIFFKFTPASFVVSISSYSSRILSSRSFSSLSQIIPTCLRENKGCSFLVGDEAPEDVPVGRTTSQSIQDIQYTAIMPSRYSSIFMDNKCVLCSNAIIVPYPSDGHSLKELKSTLLLYRVSLWKHATMTKEKQRIRGLSSSTFPSLGVNCWVWWDWMQFTLSFNSWSEMG